MMNFLAIMQFIDELLPVAQVAVAMVKTTAPAGTSNADKFAAASKAVSDTVNAATAAQGAYTQTKAAIASGDTVTVAQATTTSIETALSIFKTFNIFPKAAVVQGAAPLAQTPDPSQAQPTGA